MVNITQNDVIAYVYNEMQLTEFIAFEYALQNNCTLQEKVAEIKEIKQHLHSSTMEKLTPSQSVIDRILVYANTNVAN